MRSTVSTRRVCSRGPPGSPRRSPKFDRRRKLETSTRCLRRTTASPTPEPGKDEPMLGAFLFWLAFAVLAYQYVGYPLLLAARCRARTEHHRVVRTRRGSALGDAGDLPPTTRPRCSTARSATRLRRTTRRTASRSSSSDGSSDATNQIARSYAPTASVLHEYAVNRGKNLTLNDTLPRTRRRHRVHRRERHVPEGGDPHVGAGFADRASAASAAS